MKVNVQGGEAIFRNENGDTIIVPRNRRNEAMKYLLKDDHHSLDKLALDLPKAEHYASGGTVLGGDPVVNSTKLSKQDETNYQIWKGKLSSNLQYEGDYDLRGFYKENPNFNQNDPKQHMTDKWKLPNHPTFSNESKYYNNTTSQYGGVWKNGNEYHPNNPANKNRIIEDENGPQYLGPETTITAKKPKKSIGNFLNRWGYEHSKDPATSFLGAVGSGLASLVQLPQAAATYMLDPKGNVKPGKALTENGFNKTSVMKSIGKYAVTHNMPNDLSGMLAKAVSTEEGQNVLLDPLLAVNEVAKGISRGSELINGLKKSELINDLGNKYLPNAHKLNPKAFKPNVDAYYRGLGKTGLEDAIEMGYLRSNKMGKFGDDLYLSSSFKEADYYSNNRIPWTILDDGSIVDDMSRASGIDTGKYFAEIPKKSVNAKPYHINDTQYITNETISLDKVRFLKEDWLKGYKEIELPKSNFKSEIDWEKWVKYKEDFHNNPEVIKHLNEIEKTTKTNGTWMKNPDGSAFRGTPEQFVVQQSDNFKKAFGNSELINPDGSYEPVVHSTKAKFDEFDKSYFGQTDEGYHGEGFYFSPIQRTGFEGEFYQRPYKWIDNKTVQGTHNYGKNKMMLYVKPDKIVGDFPVDPFTEIMTDLNKPGNIKSAIGNILFDTSNPNIFKGLAPTIIAGALANKKTKK